MDILLITVSCNLHGLLSKFQVNATGNVRATDYFVRDVIFPVLQLVHRPPVVLVV